MSNGPYAVYTVKYRASIPQRRFIAQDEVECVGYKTQEDEVLIVASIYDEHLVRAETVRLLTYGDKDNPPEILSVSSKSVARVIVGALP